MVTMASIKKLMTRSALFAALGAAGVASVATTASADGNFIKFIGNGSNTSTCNTYTLCLYQNNNYGGLAIGTHGDVGESNLNNSDRVFNDKTSSIVNNSGSAYCLYSAAGGGGLRFQIHGHEVWPSLPVWINDSISSWKVGNC